MGQTLNFWSGWPQEIKETGTGGVEFFAQRSVTPDDKFKRAFGSVHPLIVSRCSLSTQAGRTSDILWSALQR